MIHISMEYFHKKIQHSAKRENITFREKASNGLWVSFLLPVAILIGNWKYKSKNELYSLAAIYSLHLLLNAVHLLYHIHCINSFYVTKKFNIMCAIPSAICMYLYLNSSQTNFKQGLSYVTANTLIYFEGLPFILKVFPNSFTFGESNLVMQGLSLFLFTAFQRLNCVIMNGNDKDEYSVSTTFLQVGHLGMIIMCTVPFVVHSMRNPLSMYLWILIVFFGFITCTLHFILDSSPFLWLFNFLLKRDRLSILTLWLICFAASGLLFWHRITVKRKADTVVRKYFHILAGVVFVTGVIYDTNLIYFASGCVFALFILLEVFRIMKIPPLYDFLQNSYLMYADEKDSGVLALTPIYLLVGYSLPLWIHPSRLYNANDFLQLLSGVLSIGVGDTCASMIGKAFGKHRYNGSNKTVEGTIACIIFQLSFVILLSTFCSINFSNFQYAKILLAVMIPSAVEALTDQIDNIVLPLITYIIIMVL